MNDRNHEKKHLDRESATEFEQTTAPTDGDATGRYNPAVATQLDLLEKKSGNWLQGVLVLTITLLLFVGAEGLAGLTPGVIIALLAVLFIHELGHLVAMLAFGYRDLRMFFLPFFGAAVSGRKLDATGAQRAIVTLAGPLPGLILCIVLSFTAIDEIWAGADRFLWLLLLLNGFNLLPFEPLDGGRFLNIVLFSRHYWIEAAFRVLAGCGFLLGAYWLREWLLAVLGIFSLLGAPYTFRVARAARQLAGDLTDQDREVANIPASRRAQIAELVAQQIENTQRRRFNSKTLAAYMRAVWQRANERVPSIGKSVALLSLYGAVLIFCLGFGWLAWQATKSVQGSTTLQTDQFSVQLPGDWPGYSQDIRPPMWSRTYERADGYAVFVVIIASVVEPEQRQPLHQSLSDTLSETFRQAGLNPGDIAAAAYGTRFDAGETDRVAMYAVMIDNPGKIAAVLYSENWPTGGRASADQRADRVFATLEIP